MFGRGAASFLALPINFDKVGIRYAAVFPEPVMVVRSHHITGENATHTSLCYSDHIMVRQNGGQAVGLDWRRDTVSAELYVLQHHRVKSRIIELINVSSLDQNERESVTHTDATGSIIVSESMITLISAKL